MSGRDRRPGPSPPAGPTDLTAKAELRQSLDDDRPTQLYDPRASAELQTTREQIIEGGTIRDMLRRRQHQLSRPIQELVAQAQRTLPEARIDGRARLRLRHEFAFDRRVGYELHLELFDAEGRCAEVSARVDQDGRAIRRGSMVSRIVEI